MAVRVESGIDKQNLSPEELERGQEWLSLLADKLAVEDRLGAVALKAGNTVAYSVEPGVSVVFAPDCLVRRELKTPVTNGGDGQGPNIVISDASMSVRTVELYRDEAGRSRVALCGTCDANGNYQVVRPRLDQLIEHRQIGVAISPLPFEQAA